MSLGERIAHFRKLHQWNQGNLQKSLELERPTLVGGKQIRFAQTLELWERSQKL